MPVISGVGFSQATPDKQHGLRKILEMHMKITESVMKKHDWVDPTYIYVDAYCGDGSPHSGVDPSPVVFVRSLKNTTLKNFKIWFIDKNPANIASLKTKFKSIPSYLNIECKDSVTYVSELARKHVRSNSFGLLYIDPNTVPDLSMLKNCSGLMPRIDFLIRMNCTAGKRILSKLRVSDIIDATDKKIWLIRRPLTGDRWQWTFLFGTNYSEIKAWESEGFYRIDSLKGKEYLDYFEYTAKEKEEIGIDKPMSGVKVESYNIFEEAK